MEAVPTLDQAQDEAAISSYPDASLRAENGNELHPFVEYIAHLRGRYLKNNRVLLVQTPQFQFEAFNPQVAKNRGLYAYPPTGLQYIAKTLAGMGLQVEVLDLNYLLLKKIIEEDFDLSRWLELLDERLDRYGPSIVGLTSLTPYNDVLRPEHTLTGLLMRLHQRDEHLVVIGGPTATNEYEEYLRRDFCHVAILKEGEMKMRYLFEVLLNRGTGCPPVSGIAYKYQGRIIITDGPASPAPLEGNLIDTYQLFPIEEYHTIGSLSPYSRMAGMGKPFSAFQLNRGCRANCKFCDVSKFMGRGVRSFRSSEVLDEIEYLVRERGVRHFEVLDDDFLGNTKVAMELLQGLVPLHTAYGVTWSANNGLIAGSLSSEICSLLRDSGCVGFRIGIESGNPNMIRRLRKPATLKLLLEKGELLQQFPEMFTGANYILGLFGEETFGQMMDTFRFSNKINLDWSSFSAFQFTSKETAIIENLHSTGKVANEFTPSKDNSRGEIPETPGAVSGRAVFSLSPEAVPTPEQVKQIWFTFNLVGNYINNKNLRPGGHPAKFVSWVEAVHVVYPFNPYMPLFAALGQVVTGEAPAVAQNRERARKNVMASAYWQHRFEQFRLGELLENFPSTKEEAYQAMDTLREDYALWL